MKMKIRSILLLSALLFAGDAKAQSGTIVDCTCLANLHELQTNACLGVIPDVCAIAFPCLMTPVAPQCSQTPAPGGPVGPGTHPITVTFIDFSTGQAVTQTCLINFVVTMPPGGCGTNSCITPPTGMVGWWPLDELTGASIYADLSGNGNAALVESGGPIGNAGSPNAVGGKVAGASFFYGPTVRGRAPNAASLNFGTNSFSMDCWVNPVPFFGGRQPIVDKLAQPTISTAFGYAVSVFNNNIELRLGDGTLYTHTGAAVTASVWNFVAVAVDRVANTVTFHVNGVTGSPQPLIPTGNFNSTNDLLIGGSHVVTNSYGELAVDEVELFNRVLTSADMIAIWQADSYGKCKPTFPCTNSTVSIFCPPSTNVQTCTTSAVVFYPPATASTSCGTITNITSVPASGSTFPLGTTVVTCTATDSQGNTASCTFNVTVTRDLTPPSCPPTSLSVTGCPPRMPDFATNGLVTDNCTPVGQISVVQSPLPGTVLSPGQTSATVMACDAASNCVTCNIMITAVHSGAPPVITCPTNVYAVSHFGCTPGGSPVAYPPPQVSNGTLVSCTPPSSSFFSNGITTVTCIATNACGTNQCTFSVIVTNGFFLPPCTPAPANMVMWLKFDETTGPSAFNGVAGNHGYLAGNPTRTLNQFVVNSLCFNGVNQYVQVTPYAAMQFGTNDFTVDVWVKPATLNNTVRTIVDHREENGPVVRGYSVFLGTNNTVGFQIADGTLINYYFNTVVPADGQWHFIAISVKRNDPLGIKLYVDGMADPNPKNPTVRPGSITAGPCFPFRVASRSSSITGLFPGCIDEVELFRRALAPSEIQAIYDARCKGKCRVSCQAGGFTGIPQCWVGPPLTNNMYINNPFPQQTFTWSIQSLPAGGGCTKPCPPFFPSSGTGTAGAFGYGVIQPVITLPTNFGVGDCVCWRLTVTMANGQQTVCDGSYCMPRQLNVCTVPNLPLVEATNLEPSTVEFSFEGAGSSSTVVTNPIAVMRSPENVVVSLTPLPTFTVPPAGGGIIQIPASFAFPDYDPGQTYTLTIEADLDGLGAYTTLSSVPVVNILPATPEEAPIMARRGLGGTIIIIWPDPCGTIEVNPNLNNPTGWSTGPVQTSPWEFMPASGDNSLFIRLRK